MYLYIPLYIIELITVCTKYVASIERKQTPHLILDTTKSGVSSETVKSFTQALGLPTISASYGQEGDLRQWRDLDESKQKYLLQVMPPADIIPEAVRSIVKRLNITNGKCGVCSTCKYPICEMFLATKYPKCEIRFAITVYKSQFKVNFSIYTWCHKQPDFHLISLSL